MGTSLPSDRVGWAHNFRMPRLTLTLVLAAAALAVRPTAQSLPITGAQFEVASIKRTPPGATGGGIRTLPDGTFTMTNQPIVSIMLSASPEPVREVVGLPGWVNTERYNVIAKAPEGSTRADQRDMMRNMLIERMKVAGHVERREQNTFALLLARRDGRLGPGLTLASAECATPPLASTPLPPERQRACGTHMSPGSVEAGAITMDMLAQSLGGLAGGFVNNRTGLGSRYAVTLRFSRSRGIGAGTTQSDDAPEIFTAVQEQLGLKLQPEKTMVPVFVVDHIERPTDN